MALKLPCNNVTLKRVVRSLVYLNYYVPYVTQVRPTKTKESILWNTGSDYEKRLSVSVSELCWIFTVLPSNQHGGKRSGKNKLKQFVFTWRI